MKKFLFATLAMCLSVGIAHAEPAPVLPPSPTLPDTTPTRIGIVGNDVIRPATSANAEIYKKVPIDKGKIGNYMKKMPKGGFLELGIAVGIVALGEAVDYLIDNSTVRFFQNACHIHTQEIGKPFDAEGYSKNVCGRNEVRVIKNTVFTNYVRREVGCFFNNGILYSSYFLYCAKPKELGLDEMADKVVDSAKKGNPTAVRVINDWADDEIKRNPDAYPDVVPQPQPQPQPDPVPNPDPNPKPNPLPVPSPVPQPTPSPNPNPIGDPKTNPSPNPNAPPSGNPATNPNPADNPSGTPNAQPDPATNPSDGTKPNEQTFKFELPAFCSWAGVVCDFIDWVRQEPPQDEPPKTVPKKGVGDIPELSDVDRYKERIDFQGQCPTGQISFGINGTQYSYIMPYTHFCQLLEQLAPWLLAFTYLSTAYFIVSNL